VGEITYKPLGKGCKITHIPTDIKDDHSRRWVRIARLDAREGYLPFAHYNCSHNQLAALRNRVLADVPLPSVEGIKVLRRTARSICKFLPTVPPAGWFDMPNHYHGHKRAKYLRAVEDVLQTGYNRSHAKIQMFVKFEKLDSRKHNPDPRAIQFRHPRYCVALGRFLKPMEAYLYRLHGDGVTLPATRMIGKGLSSDERAQLLVHKINRFSDAVVVSLDASRFDLHVSKELLEVEHLVYLHMNDDPELRELLSWQLDNVGVTSMGIKYKCRGRRMSGDMNTALGNCLLMIIMVATFMEGRVYDILDDGDDCLLIIERGDLPWVLDNVHKTFLTYGMEIKIEKIAYTLEEVEWCQCRPIRVSHDKVKFIRNPYKVFSTALCGTKYFTQEGARRKLINTIGMSELVLNLGVPVLQEYAQALMRNAETTKSFSLDHLESYFHRLKRELKALNLKHLVRVNPIPITHEARVSFHKAYGMSPAVQLDTEEFLRSWSFNISTTEALTPEINPGTWAVGVRRSEELYSVWDDC
jgi:hypothetical protein